MHCRHRAWALAAALLSPDRAKEKLSKEDLRRPRYSGLFWMQPTSVGVLVWRLPSSRPPAAGPALGGRWWTVGRSRWSTSLDWTGSSLTRMIKLGLLKSCSNASRLPDWLSGRLTFPICIGARHRIKSFRRCLERPRIVRPRWTEVSQVEVVAQIPGLSSRSLLHMSAEENGQAFANFRDAVDPWPVSQLRAFPKRSPLNVNTPSTGDTRSNTNLGTAGYIGQP